MQGFPIWPSSALAKVNVAPSPLTTRVLTQPETSPGQPRQMPAPQAVHARYAVGFAVRTRASWASSSACAGWKNSSTRTCVLHSATLVLLLAGSLLWKRLTSGNLAGMCLGSTSNACAVQIGECYKCNDLINR